MDVIGYDRVPGAGVSMNNHAERRCCVLGGLYFMASSSHDMQ